MEILNFLRDNNVHDMTEADCYYMVKFFDSDEDGRLHYPDFMQMVLPCDNHQLRASATQRPNMQINRGDFLTLDVERDLAALLVAEIELHRGSEKIKQQLEAQLDYSQESVYQEVDDWRYGYVDVRNLHRFFRNNRSKATEEDCVAIIRRFDLDADSKLSRDEFLNGITAQEPFSKMIVREKMARKEEQLKARQNIKEREAAAASKKVTKKVDEPVPLDKNWTQQETLKTRAMDRSYKSVMSVSPLKYRVEYDLEGSPAKRMDTMKSPTPRKSVSKGRNVQSTVQKQDGGDYYGYQ